MSDLETPGQAATRRALHKATWEQAACSECHAEPGESCRGRAFDLAHSARIRAVVQYWSTDNKPPIRREGRG